MKHLLQILLYGFAALIVIVVMLVFFGISNEPEAKLDWTMTQADINRAKNILREGYKTRPDQIGTIELSSADLNLTTNYLINQFTKGRAIVSLKPNKLKFTVTAALPENFAGKYVNITFRLGNEDENPLPTLTKFKAGKLLLPPKIAAYVIETVIKNTKLNEYFILATHPIKAVAINADKIAITYHPSQATVDTARDLLAYNKTTYDHARVYKAKLTEIIRQHDPNWLLSLAELLQPLFALAYQRSSLETAIEENRTIINLVNDYVNISKTVANPITPHLPAYLYKRYDLAQHFIGAAAVTTSVNGQIAQVLGEEKELRDAQGGSGFSFIDLTADKAGTRFGELATASPQSARKLQEKMAAIKDYTAFMPDPRHLPEPMDEATFKERYGTIYSEAYQEVTKQMDALIAATPIYRK
jgi:hypothetical protein